MFGFIVETTETAVSTNRVISIEFVVTSVHVD